MLDQNKIDQVVCAAHNNARTHYLLHGADPAEAFAALGERQLVRDMPAGTQQLYAAIYTGIFVDALLELKRNSG